VNYLHLLLRLKYAKEGREKEVLINDVLSWKYYTAVMTGE
jgi:hypothetical protein